MASRRDSTEPGREGDDDLTETHQAAELSFSVPAASVRDQGIISNDGHDANLKRTPITSQIDPMVSSHHLTSESDSGRLHLATNHKPTEDVDHSFELWNDAYDKLEADVETAKVANAYRETLAELLTEGELELRKNDAPVTETRAVISKSNPHVRDEIKATKLEQLNDRQQRQRLLTKYVDEGQEKRKLTKMSERVGISAEAILKTKPVVDIAIQIPYAAAAALPWAGVVIGLQILANPGRAKKSNLDGIIHVTSRMNWYCAICNMILNNKPYNTRGIGDKFQLSQEELKSKIVTLFKEILFYQMKSVCSYYKNRGLVFLRGLSNWDDWDGYLKKVIDAEQTLENDSAQFRGEQAKHALNELVEIARTARMHDTELQKMHQDIHQTLQSMIESQEGVYRDEKDRIYMEDLFVVYPKYDMEQLEGKKGGLLKGVFSWVVDTDQYGAFAHDTAVYDSGLQSQLLWVKGLPGMGKTMVVIGIVRELAARTSPSLSYYFCQGTERQAQNSATAVLRSLIWMILAQQPALMKHLRSEHKLQHKDKLFENNKNAFQTASRLFERIIIDAPPTYLVVDALDECDEDLDGLMRLISKSLQRFKHVKWLVSSRPNIDVLSQLKKYGAEHLDEAGSVLKLDSQSLRRPVEIYTEHKLLLLEARDGYTARIVDDLRGLIRRRSENMFLWVSLVFDELDREDVDLNQIHGSEALDIAQKMPPGLHELYRHLMLRIEGKSGKYPQYCKKILAVIAVANRPLSLEELAVVAGLRSNGLEPFDTVKNCGSYLKIDEQIVSLVHQSAKQYICWELEQRGRDGQSILHVTTSDTHVDITIQSIGAMSMLYDLRQKLFHKRYQAFSTIELSSLQYSCIHWIDHLVAWLNEASRVGELPGKRDYVYSEAIKFMTTHFLQWFESVAVLGKAFDAIIAIERLLELLKNPSAIPLEFVVFLKDAERFATAFHSIVEETPLQVYGAALAFSPTNNEVHKHFWELRQPFITRVNGSKIDLGSFAQFLPVGEECYGAAFSPDRTLLVLASSDKLQLRDVGKGAVLHSVHAIGPIGYETTVAISRANDMVALGLTGGIIDLWNISTGTRRTLKSSWRNINSTAFSPDGTMLAIAGNTFQPANHGVELWNIEAGSNQLLQGHDGLVEVVTFSRNCQLASGGKDGLIQIWDEKSGVRLRTLTTELGEVGLLVYSGNATILAAGVRSPDYTANEIRLWKIGSEVSPVAALQPGKSFSSMALSEDGTLVAAALDDHVRLWNVVTNSSRVISILATRLITFLDQDSRFAILSWTTGGNDLLVTDLVDIPDTPAGHGRAVGDLVFSESGATLASASDDGMILLWNTNTCSHQRTLELQGTDSQCPKVMKFSVDGTTLAVITGDLDIWIWNILANDAPQVLDSPQSAPEFLVFSENNKRLASKGIDEDALLLWNLAEGELEATCRHGLGRVSVHTKDPVNSAVFSTDCQLLASASLSSVCLWSANSGDFIMSLPVASNLGLLLRFSTTNSCLYTSRGTLKLEFNTESDGALCNFNPTSQPTLYFSFNEDWILYRSKALLRLPPQYQPSWGRSAYAVHGNLVALGHESGDVTIIEFDLGLVDGVEADIVSRSENEHSEVKRAEHLEATATATATATAVSG